jgi:uncharacterized protein YdeI (BOF family)
MKLTKLFTLVILLLSIGVTTPMMAQVRGGRKKEHRNQRGGGGKFLVEKAEVMLILLPKAATKRTF